MSERTTPVWFDGLELPAFPRLEGDQKADVCVIGGGIAGCTTAYLLAKEGLSVVLLEQRNIGAGETGNTTAHLSNAIDDRIFKMIDWHGEDNAKLAVESHTAAIDRIEQIVKAEKIDCDFLRVDGFLFLGEGDEQEILDKELDAAHTVGFTDVEMLSQALKCPFVTGTCLRFPNQGQFHAMKYLVGLAQAAAKNGVSIYEKAHVSAIDDAGTPIRVSTEHGPVIRASSVVVATNAPINDNAAIYTKQVPYRTYAIGMALPKDAMPPMLLWDTLDPYHYVRMQPTDDGDILIVGGEDHRTGHAVNYEERFDALESWTREWFPMIGNRAFFWSGQVMESLDGLGLIGRKPGGNETTYVATGDSGMGMTHGTIAGILLTDLICGRTNEWEELYDPDRLRPSSLLEFAKGNAGTAKDLAGGWVGPAEVSDAQDVKPGEGALMRSGMKKIALYRDPQGTLHSYSAVCPHKGCIVQWNGLEKSWECPCHGSRFDTDGKVANGPTISHLEPVELDPERP